MTDKRPYTRRPHVTAAEKRVARRLRASGMSMDAIGKVLCRSGAGIGLSVVGVERGPKRTFDDWQPAPGRLQPREREQIMLGLGRGDSMRAIARGIGRSASTVSRDVLANGGREDYHPFEAHHRARACVRRPKPAKLDAGPLCDQVTEWLEELWSPKEITGRLRNEFGHDPMMQVSHETIYQSLYVQGRGELRRELARCLRRGHTVRKSQGLERRQGKILDMVMIAERPAEVADRAVPGHWEGDLMLGKNGGSQVGTLVERSTRFVLLLHLPKQRTAVNVETAMRKAIRTLPAELARSVTWDQGKELANHKTFTVATGIPVYFCDPHSPWQRGSNENTNGLLRQYMPKGMDLSTLTAKDLATIQRSLNNRPRETLGFMKPSEKLAELVALTV
jgi:transposase, IS30 family